MENRAFPSFTKAALLVLSMALASCNSSNALKSGSSSKSSTSSLVGQSVDGLTVVASLPAPERVRQGKSALLAANDLLLIKVFQVADLDREVRVDANGVISMPLIGSLRASGLTSAELELQLERKYGRAYLQNPDVSVFVKESSASQVTMDGEFTKPGLIPVTAQSTLLQSVAQAGGLTKIGDEAKVFVFRQYNNGRRVANYSLADIRAGKQGNPKIYGGDVVVAFASKRKIATENLKDALGVASSAARIATPF